MFQHLSLIAIIVRDYDEAISFYVGRLGFELIEDTRLTTDKRWVVVGPRGSNETRLLLAKATDERQSGAIGNQSGGRVFLFLESDDFQRDHAAFLRRGIRFIREPRIEPYGIVAVFEDIYGNQWDLIQSNPVR